MADINAEDTDPNWLKKLDLSWLDDRRPVEIDEEDDNA